MIFIYSWAKIVFTNASEIKVKTYDYKAYLFGSRIDIMSAISTSILARMLGGALKC